MRLVFIIFLNVCFILNFKHLQLLATISSVHCSYVSKFIRIYIQIFVYISVLFSAHVFNALDVLLVVVIIIVVVLLVLLWLAIKSVLRCSFVYF